jgi:uncharacterized protein YsxB (DUF464 family)
MTRVTYQTKGNKLSVSIQGHAEYTEEPDKDIVCSAISALATTLGNAVDNLGAVVELKITPGDVVIVASAKNGTKYNELLLIYEVIVAGLQMLEMQYPENINVSIG